MKAHDQALDTAILALVIGAADPARPQDDSEPAQAGELRGRQRREDLAVVCAPDLLEGDPGHRSNE